MYIIKQSFPDRRLVKFPAGGYHIPQSKKKKKKNQILHNSRTAVQTIYY